MARRLRGRSLTGRRRRWDPGSRDPLLSLGMKMIVLLLVFISCLTVPTLSSFWQFQRMVKHITGRSAFLSYYGYGCYCGLGGKGVPVDDTDRCCLTHDCCYKKLKESGCQPVLNSYQFHVINKTVVCGCSLGPGGSCLCGLKACECDRQSAFCFRRSLPTYERNFKLLSGRPPCGRQKLQC
ncbi:putative inactive group IIC secretory phospholipase A2 isoform X2 [Sciurus carolinensis]|uniref:putative inactive group IIC secretory phospholipase A2 isoform X2 n=1 Tax=Sciurus carolinensis TaxID=30640 RepID=UPI001FB4967F|nr:putative inactive group IIC secretory phospholipase A2 isoform X2 [Sciurus carolinensis]